MEAIIRLGTRDLLFWNCNRKFFAIDNIGSTSESFVDTTHTTEVDFCDCKIDLASNFVAGMSRGSAATLELPRRWRPSRSPLD